MSAEPQGPLTEQALSIQSDNKQFQQKLTQACSQASTNPAAALTDLDWCWQNAGALESKQLEFLVKMGDFGARQAPATKEGWRQNRLQALVGKTQALLMLGRYDHAQSTVDLARTLVSGPDEIAFSLLDQLEMSIVQARG